MQTSTPLQYRSQPPLTIDPSPVGERYELPNESNSSMDTVSSKDDSTGVEVKQLLSTRLNGLKLTPLKKESHIFREARDSIAANETLDASDAYRRRINTYPVVGFSYGMNGSILRPAKSHLDVSIVHDESDKFINKASRMDITDDVDGKFINKASRKDITDDLWVNENGTYGLDILFMEQGDAEEREIEDVILQKTKNKLFEIFLKACPNRPIARPGRMLIKKPGEVGGTGVSVTPGKRSLSPQPEHHQGNPTKTACRTPGTRISRDRANSVSGVAGMSRPKSRKRLYTISGQKLLTSMWKKNVE